MSVNLTRVATAVMAAAIITLASGCASTEQIEEIQRMAREAKGAAERAERTANRAESTANSAASQAQQALQAANEAQACCTANSEKLDRMFKKSMTK